MFITWFTLLLCSFTWRDMAVQNQASHRMEALNGRLSVQDRNRLATTIGLGRKEFRLLYSASRDGCSAATFHRLCDLKGPTAVVLYNTFDTVYGGYTSMSWCSTGTYIYDTSAILFQLKQDGKPQSMSFKCTTPSHAIYCNSDRGPEFGNSSLLVFTKPADKSGATATDTFPLDGEFNTDKGYNLQGMSYKDFCNGTLAVTDIEVYSVYDDPKPDLSRAGLVKTAWRKSKICWSSPMEALKQLKSDIENYSPIQDLLTSEARFPYVNILLMGPIGAGKSSFFNTENSVFRGMIFNQARSGRAEHSLTTKFTKYRIVSGETNKPLAFRLCDTRGLEPDYLMSRENIRYLLEGHLPDKQNIDPRSTISSDTPGFVKYPGLEEKIHCVVFCIDASIVDGLADLMPEVIQNIKDLQIVMNGLDIPQMVVLTKVDSVCRHTKENVKNVFRSPMVEQCVNKVAEDLGLPRNLVLPMKNYEKEGDLDDYVNVLALLNLREILNNCDAHLFNHYNEIMKNYSRRPGASN